MVVVMVSPCFWQIFQAIAFPVFEGQQQVKNVNSAAGDGSSAAGDVIIVGTAILAVIGIIIVGIIIIAAISIIVAVIIIIAVISIIVAGIIIGDEGWLPEADAKEGWLPEGERLVQVECGVQ